MIKNEKKPLLSVKNCSVGGIVITTAFLMGDPVTMSLTYPQIRPKPVPEFSIFSIAALTCFSSPVRSFTAVSEPLYPSLAIISL
ncbi:MAG: hypothetical protein BWY32_03799 [bacterium ADurb.Bin243]|nr:MAG: hypothetical protein BWY32_03799 [bacterium ADurb.Bin243]